MSAFNHVSNSENPLLLEEPIEPHLALVLLLDTSASMAGEAIESLNKGVNELINQIAHGEKTCKRVDLAIIEFNDTARVVQDFVPIRYAEPVNLTASGSAAMGQAINMAIDKVKQKNRDCFALGRHDYIPWIVMITDGPPTDDIAFARQRIIVEESKHELIFWVFGTPGCVKETLQSLTKRYLELDGTTFDGFSDWLTNFFRDILYEYLSFDPDILYECLSYGPNTLYDHFPFLCPYDYAPMDEPFDNPPPDYLDLLHVIPEDW